jgi:DNA (cytosine-5)-methyltransferase 1
MPTPQAYYNEFDVKAAAWLRELIKAGHIAPGDVDTRSITDVAAIDLKGYTQCHFFAGIGGWSYALRLAGWPDERPVWTGSCPCQPFSAAGQQGGTDDPRHLWPEFYRLIHECRPATVFGEQVASKAGLAWLDIVCIDMERTDYAIGAADMCAAGVGAPHIRQRLYFVAHANSQRLTRLDALLREENNGRFAAPAVSETSGRGEPSNPVGQADGNRPRLEIGGTHEQRAKSNATIESCSYVSELAESPRQSRCWRGDSGRRRREPTDGRKLCGVDWSTAEFIPCTDGKARPIEPGTFPLAHGIPARVGLLRGYGNAIVPEVGAEFIGAYLDLTC